MSVDALRAAADGSSADRSRVSLPRPGVLGLRAAFAAAGLVGAILLLAATGTTVTRIKVLTTSNVLGGKTHFTGWDLHGPALAIIAVLAIVMLAGALRGARPALWALALLAVVGLVLIAAIDVPRLNDTRDIAKLYEDVSAGAASGFYLETAGAVALLLAAGGLLLLSGVRVREAGEAPGVVSRAAGASGRGALRAALAGGRVAARGAAAGGRGALKGARGGAARAKAARKRRAAPDDNTPAQPKPEGETGWFEE